MSELKSMKINYPLKDVTFSENSSDFRPNASLPEYPYGLRLCLDDKALKMLGIAKVPEVGSKMKLNAVVEVCSTSAYETKESGLCQSMDLQITDMSLDMKSKKPVDADKMYNSKQVGVVNEIEEKELESENE